MNDPSITFPLATGIVLASACGFRVFIPPLIYSIAASLGWIELSDSFLWLESPWIRNIFIFATLVEILGYLIPWVDNALDLIATPVSIFTGIAIVYISVDSLSPENQWLLASIAGAPGAAIPQIGTSSLRAVSSAGTAGIANPILSLVEDFSAIFLCLLAILAPILGLIAIASLFVFIIIRVARKIFT